MNTLEILAELGFTYHIDNLSADEPFLQIINGQPFATVPYTAHLNDISSFDVPGFNPAVVADHGHASANSVASANGAIYVSCESPLGHQPLCTCELADQRHRPGRAAVCS